MVWLVMMLGCGGGTSPETNAQYAMPDWPGEKRALYDTKEVRKHDIVVGEGVTATGGDRVTVHYTGWLVNGTMFDSSHKRGAPFSATLGRGEVIAGWDRGVRGMAVGGKRGLVLPPHLAYGDRGVGDIPPDSVLVFEIELVALQSAGH